MDKKNIGISGLTAYIPPFRVWLEDWCDWTDNQWPKIREVVGRSFRVRGPNQSVYTLAATAVMRLIKQYDIDPTRVKFLGLGTESSTDNSAGAIIVKGMVDRALIREGKAPVLAVFTA
jgi:hydroxymethylglutaryl-CoA synthase